MRKYKNICELVVFVILLTLCFNSFYNAVRVKDRANGGGLESYYDLKVPVDVAVFGSSHAGCTVNNAIMWRDYGISSYTLWSASQAVDGTYLFMKEAFKTHKPKVALVETLNVVLPPDNERSIYLSALAVKYSPDYIRFSLKKAKEFGYSRSYVEELLARFPFVHSRYKELEKADFFPERSYNRGYQGSDETNPSEPPQLTTERYLISTESMYYIEKMVELCRENDVELVFFHAPYVMTDENSYQQMLQNDLAEYCKQENVPFLDYYRDHEQCNIDFSCDLREGDHLNDSGAAKVTNALAAYLEENYDMPDRRSESGFGDWDTHARFVDDRQLGYELKRHEDINDYLTVLGENKDKYHIVVSLEGSYRAIEGYHEPLMLECLGISTETSDEAVYVVKNSEIAWSSGDSKNYQYSEELGPCADLNIYRGEGDFAPHILVNGIDVSREINGISISVYDKECAYLIDDVYADVFQGSNVIRVQHDD